MKLHCDWLPTRDLLPAGSFVAVDTETTGGTHPDPPENSRVAVVSIGFRLDDRIESMAFPIAFGHGRGAQGALDFGDVWNLDREMWDKLLAWLASMRLVFHSAKFDLMMLAVGSDLFEGIDLSAALAWDCVLAARELDPELEASLEALEQRADVFDRETRADWNASKKLRAKVNDMEWERAERYAKLDAHATYAVFEDQVDRFDCGEGDRFGYNQERRLTKALLAAERRGVGYDAEESMRIAKEIADVENQIKLGLPFRATLPGAKKYFYTTLRMTPSNTTPSGAPQLNDAEVTRLVNLGVPHAKEYQDLRHLEVARTKWYESYASMTGWDGRLRTTFSQAKVISGRLSSTRVNLQAIPQDYQLEEITAQGWPSPRQLFKAKKGAKLWELDLGQAELRVAAVEAGCQPMLEMLHEQRDIHGEVTTQLFKTKEGDPTWKRDRSVGKRADFALIFGVGAEEFQANVAKFLGIWIPLPECSRIVRSWRRLFPEYGRAIAKYMENANHLGYVRLINGRPRHFRSYEDQHKAFNQYVQGSLAEFMKEWMIQAEDEYPGVILLTIHDSLVLETADPTIVAGIKLLGEEVGTQWFKVPMVVDMKEWEAA